MWLVSSIPLVVVLRGISPLLTIRFAKVQTDRLGHMFTIEVYLSEQDLGLRPKRTFDIFYFYAIPSISSNQQVYKMWQQNVYFFHLYTWHILQIESIASYQDMKNTLSE